MRTYNDICMIPKDDFLFLIKHLSKIVELRLDKEINKLGLTPQQGRLLNFLSKMEEEDVKVRQTDIEERFSLSKSTVSGLIKRMICKDLIYKKKISSDYYLYPTENGKEVISKFREEMRKVKESISSYLEEDERTELIKTLNKLIECMKEDEQC